MTDPGIDRPFARAADEVVRALHVSPEAGLSAVDARARLAESGPNELEEHARPSVWRALLDARDGAVRAPARRRRHRRRPAQRGARRAPRPRRPDPDRRVPTSRPPIDRNGHWPSCARRSRRARTSCATGRAQRSQRGRSCRATCSSSPPVTSFRPMAACWRVAASSSTAASSPASRCRSGRAAAPDADEAPLAERHSMVYAGTSVVGGRGLAVTVATGSATELGSIAGTLGGTKRRRSPLQRELDRLVRILLVAAIILIVVTVGLGFLRGQPAGANILAGISAAIAAIPEEPPVLLAVVLGLGAYRLMRRGVLVRRLAAQEALGAVDLIITDKTGTLTRNRLAVEAVLPPDGTVPRTGVHGLLLEALAAEEDAWTATSAGRRGSFTGAPSRPPSRSAGSRPTSTRGRWRPRPLPPTAARTAPCATATTTAGASLCWGRRRWLLPAGSGDDDGGRASCGRRSADAAAGCSSLAARSADAPWQTRALIRFGDPIRDGVPAAVATATRGRDPDAHGHRRPSRHRLGHRRRGGPASRRGDHRRRAGRPDRCRARRPACASCASWRARCRAEAADRPGRAARRAHRRGHRRRRQ